MAAAKKKSKVKTKVMSKGKPKSAARASVKKAAPKSKSKPVTKTLTKAARRGQRPSSSAIKAPSAKALAALLLPLQDRLLILVEGASETTAGGIIIPGTVAERPNRGTVVAAGTGRRNKKGALRPLDVSVGDAVLFSQYAGTGVTLEGSDFLILREEEILGITTR